MTVKTNLDRRLQLLENRAPAEKVVFLWDSPIPTESDKDVTYIRFVWEAVPDSRAAEGQ